MRTVISWSGGKDSTATIILAHEMGIRIDHVVFSEVMYDRIRGISGEWPEFIEWMYDMAIPKVESWGCKVNVLRAEKDFLDLFFHRSTRGRNKGKMCGYMIPGRCWANKELKIMPIRRFLGQIDEPILQYIGIAADEPKRLARLKPNMRSLLAESNMTEADAYELCRSHGLLSPMYSHQHRGGCWFCPNARISSYAMLKQNHPELYDEFIGLANSLIATRKFAWRMSIDDLADAVDRHMAKNKNQPTLNI